MKKRIVALALAMMAATACFGACNGGGNQGDSNTITFGVSQDASEYNTALALKRAYESKNPDITIEIKQLQNYQQDVVNALRSDTLPDVLFTQDDTVAYFAQNGVFEPLDTYMTNSGVDASQYYDVIMEIAKPLDDNKVYFMPRDYNKVVCFINEDMFEAANIEIPSDDWTWDDFLAICAQFRTKMDENANTKAGLRAENFPVFANVGWKAVYWPVIASYGETIFNASNDFALTADSQGLAALKNLVDNRYTVDASTNGTGQFKEGKVAMAFSVRPNLSSYLEEIDANFVSFPAITANNSPKVGMGCSGYGITSTSDNKDKAWDFLKFIISQEGQEAFSATGNCIPVIKSMADSTCWKNITVSEVDISAKNHAAFTKYSERDLVTNYMGSIAPGKHSSIYTQMDEMMKQMYSDDYKNDLASCISTYKTRIENIIG